MSSGAVTPDETSIEDVVVTLFDARLMILLLREVDDSPVCFNDVYPWVLTHAGNRKNACGIMNIVNGAFRSYTIARIEEGMNPRAANVAAVCLVKQWASCLTGNADVLGAALALLAPDFERVLGML